MELIMMIMMGIVHKEEIGTRCIGQLVRIKGKLLLMDRVDLGRHSGLLLVMDRGEGRDADRDRGRGIDKEISGVSDQLELQLSEEQLLHHQEGLMLQV